jgi:hypothetical protein
MSELQSKDPLSDSDDLQLWYYPRGRKPPYHWMPKSESEFNAESTRPSRRSKLRYHLRSAGPPPPLQLIADFKSDSESIASRPYPSPRPLFTGGRRGPPGATDSTPQRTRTRSGISASAKTRSDDGKPSKHDHDAGRRSDGKPILSF